MINNNASSLANGIVDHSNETMSPFKPHWDLYPKSYVAPKTSFPLIDHLDGDLTKDVWKNVSFSDVFDDIRGSVDAPSEDRPNSNCRTRFKAMWDNSHLYIGAVLESDFETQAHFTERNSPIYQKDSDFEVFVDPFGSCHNYKELEVNPINTVWNLMLDRPYDDDGHEFSGRIAKPGDDRYYEVSHQKTATKLLEGTLNDSNGSATWSVEVALSFEDLLAHTDASQKGIIPGVDSALRINFSRVEKQGAINWTWQPQVVWDPPNQRYSGFVAMHLPDAWGYMVFGEEQLMTPPGNGDDTRPKSNTLEPATPRIQRDPSWPARVAAMNVYYAQRHYFNQNDKNYATSIDSLEGFVDDLIVTPFQITIKSTPGGYKATVRGGKHYGKDVVITNNRFLQVVDPSGKRVDTA